jgi:hypothetical protein
MLGHAPAGLILELDIGERLTLGVADAKSFRPLSRSVLSPLRN